MAAFVNGGPTLLVSFESRQGIQALSPSGHPFGWDMAQGFGWSHMGLICDGDTWFRDPAVFAFFDNLSDEGVFDGYDEVLFYGAGPCGYAAAAFSVAAPGARVLAIQPQATLDPDLAGWDPRFVELRRIDFRRRYGYAPRMLDAAARAYVIYDPMQREDAMHAALFAAPHVTRLTLPNMGSALQTDLLEMDVLYELLAMAADMSLERHAFSMMMRARRDHPPYLRRLLARLERDERTGLAEMLCRNVAARLDDGRFLNKLQRLQAS
ncbi:phosphoadenosine phosphosulfate reductase [Sulfitobacter sp. D35]|uniref:phosphoadenosine phosphosulfate reductase n=1 Tax=Sulfitobacter sp. D35 TaxID=3083252 RepID=UPI00296E5756|nr:phosphoadenosine phosphosulfate reductase [Sulfitobacter sp. D35]MDW4497512.1 phosphoadenosine phosphosulfate reductase [Sulfitobacter sp. D35]